MTNTRIAMRELRACADDARQLGRDMIKCVNDNPMLVMTMVSVFEAAYQAFLDAPTTKSLDNFLDLMLSTGNSPAVSPYLVQNMS